MKTETMMNEALARLQMLENKFDLNPNIKKYLADGKLYYSYITAGGYMGSIDTIGYDERYQNIVAAFEQTSGYFVYHVIEDEDSIALLYVSDTEENWEKERPQKAFVFAHVVDVNCLESEDGYIKLDVLQGALRRRTSDVFASLPEGKSDENGMDEIAQEVVQRLNILIAGGLQTDLNIVEIYQSEGQICSAELKSVMGEAICIVDRLNTNETYRKFAKFLSAEVPVTFYFMMVTQEKKLAFLFVDEDKANWASEKLALELGCANAVVLDVNKLTATVQKVEYEIVAGGPLCII